MQKLATLLREPEGLRYNGAAVTYTVAGYLAGLAGLFHPQPLVNVAAVVLLAHAMTIAAYLVHECGHNLVFRQARHNARLGTFLCWLCGACYGTYEDIRYKHFRHHIDNDDVVWFDYERFFREHPAALRVTRWLEWCYIPAHDLLMHAIMVFTSFIIPERRNQRRRNVTVIAIRGGIYIALLVAFPKAALLYALAYMLMMTVLRFMDSIQHDYPYSLTLFGRARSPRRGDAAWEQAHTFSNPHSLRYERLNWLTLNFGFHNAHHDDMSVPWYRLPERHRALFADPRAAVIPIGAQLRIFHRQRVRRIVDNHDGTAPEGRDYLRAAQRAEVYGGNAASFLTSF
ncbi:MAG TPA: fatty acid desaturase [Woeseiaceae bacterium]|nr:fatty acid desaturase [Woeseiaceae bacterium]